MSYMYRNLNAGIKIKSWKFNINKPASCKFVNVKIKWVINKSLFDKSCEELTHHQVVVSAINEVISQVIY